MTDVVIKAENLGKHDTIGHQAANGRYVAPARCAGAERAQPMRGKPLILSNALEEV